MSDTYYLLQAPNGYPTVTRMSAKELQEWLNAYAQRNKDPCFYNVDDLDSSSEGRDLTGLAGTIIIHGEEFHPTKKEVVTQWRV